MPDNFLNFSTLGMGNTKSKRKGPLGRSKLFFSHGSGTRETANHSEAKEDHEFLIDIHERWAEDSELRIIRRTIENNPEMFILNNLMMCVQFFENYDEEIVKIRDTLVSSREVELNDRLPPQAHTLIPDVLQQHVARKVDFTYMLPTLKHTIELLQPIRIYVVFDNIEISERSYASPYCSVNGAITYSMQLKPSPDHRGYVQLQRLEVNPPKKTASADDLRSSSVTNGSRDEIYSESDSVYTSKNIKSSVAVSRRTKKVYDLSNDDSVYDDDRYGTRGNIDGEQIGEQIGEQNDDKVSRKKLNPMRGGSGNNDGHSGKAKLVFSANGSPAGSTSSGYKSENYTDIGSDSSYARTTYSSNPEKTSKSSLGEDGSAEVSSTEIPPECFKKIEYRADGTIYDARRERRQKLSNKEQRIWQAHQSRNYHVWYLNSEKFMKYFCQIFTEQLAAPMGFDTDIIDNVHGSVIYRDKIEIVEGTMSTKLEAFEIVPCVSSQWPECAQEWLDRTRTSWPEYDVIEKVKEFGCHMIPEGPANEKANGRFQDLEWQLIFPAAERFLETCLTHPQVRVYLIGLMLHKTFVKPANSIFGLTTAHIKNRLFWMIEEDNRPGKWTDNKTGEALMRLLNSLYRSISQDEPNLPDFFIREKNLFQEKSCLLRTQKQLKRILENPVMYVFYAMENIRHSRRFFPRLDYEELLRILTADALTLVNPDLVSFTTKPIGRSNMSEKDYDHIEGMWDNPKRKHEEGPKSYAKKPVTIRNLINPRTAYDQVIEIPIRCASLQPLRLSSLLNFFIKHFIKMAEYCHKYGAVAQKETYVEQAERLSVLLSEHPRNKDDARTYLEKLCSLKKTSPKSRSQSEPPKTPRRNPDMPVFIRPMNDRYQMPDFQIEIGAQSRISEESQQDETEENLQSRTRVLINEENTKNVDRVELHQSENAAVTGEPSSSNKRSARVVTLGDEGDASFLTETSYL